MRGTAVYFFFLAFFSCGIFRAQSPVIDSLKRLIKVSAEDTVKMHLLYQVSEESFDLSEVLSYARQTLKLATQLSLHPDKKIQRAAKQGIGKALNNIGYVHNERGESGQGLNYFKLSLRLDEELGDKPGIANSIQNLGAVYLSIGQIENALDCFLKSVKLFEELKDDNGKSYAYNNLGFIHENLDEKEKALDYYYKALKLREKTGNKQGIAESCNSIGSILTSKNRLDEAETYLLRGFNLCLEIGDKENAAATLTSLAIITHARGDFKEALFQFEGALNISEEVEHKLGIAATTNNIAAIFFEMGDLKTAQKFAERSLAVAEDLGFPENISNAAQRLSLIYDHQYKFKEAYSMHLLYKRMDDSLNSMTNKKASTQKHMQYEFDKKEMAVKAEQEKKDILAAEKTQQSRIIIGIVSACILLGLFFLFFIFRSYRLKKRANSELGLQKKVIEEKQKEILDSIRYAKRIQNSLLPSEKLIDKNLRRLNDTHA